MDFLIDHLAIALGWLLEYCSLEEWQGECLRAGMIYRLRLECPGNSIAIP